MQPIKLMGDGYEPHVDQLGDKLIYSLPVDSSFVSNVFSFEIRQVDLDVLLSDNYRRAVLEVVAYVYLQSYLQSYVGRRDNRYSQNDFDRLIMEILHSTPDELQVFIKEARELKNMGIERRVKDIMDRRSALS